MLSTITFTYNMVHSTATLVPNKYFNIRRKNDIILAKKKKKCLEENGIQPFFLLFHFGGKWYPILNGKLNRS